ncbi:MAG: hypothetical protein FWE05_11060 [Defluviitaleaceae bacterium]|nr:hypothetical protein [Defluviitaleaceae bacterium]
MLNKSKAIAGISIVFVLFLAILTHQWIWPVLIGNHFRESTWCIACSERLKYYLESRQLETPADFYGDGVRREITGESVEEAFSELRPFHPTTCDDCLKLIANIMMLPYGSPEWENAWDAYHAPHRR